MKVVIGPDLRKMSVKYWARYGHWPESLKLVLRGAPVPGVMVNEAVIARAKEKQDQEIRDSRPSGLLPEEE